MSSSVSSLSYSFQSKSHIPVYFTLFDAIVNGTVFLISLFDSLLLVYRKATGFCILILYPDTLMNSWILSFLVVSLEFSIYSIMSFVNSNSFTFYFPIWFPFIISFPCLIAVSWTFNTMLNKSGKYGHLCLVPDLRENAFKFSLLSMI